MFIYVLNVVSVNCWRNFCVQLFSVLNVSNLCFVCDLVQVGEKGPILWGSGAHMGMQVRGKEGKPVLGADASPIPSITNSPQLPTI